jgi:hypothetical protein
MAAPTNRRISAMITLHGDGSAAVSVLLIEADGKQTSLSVPPIAHPEALEGFIYALAAQHGVAPDAIDLAVDDRRSPFHGHQPPGQVH